MKKKLVSGLTIIYLVWLGVGLVLFIAMAGNAMAQNCVTPGPIAKWKGEGNANDSVGSFHGVWSGPASYAPGQFGQAFDFDGLNNWVNLPNTNAFHNLGGEFTWDAWINANTINGRFMVFAEGDYEQCEDIYMGIGTPFSDQVVPPPGPNDNVFGAVDPESGSLFGCGVRNQFSVEHTGLAAGTWHHLAMTVGLAGTGDVKLYVDGVEVASDPRPASPITRSLLATIGAFNDGNQAIGFYAFDGLIDEVEVYNRELSASEIAAIFNCGEDIDGDGIMNPVDGYVDPVLGFIDESYIVSDDFTDEDIGGASFGYIQSRAALTVTVEDAANLADGLLISATGAVQQKARVRVCDLSPPDGRIQLSSGDSIIVTCGSMKMEVLQGPVELLIVDDDVEVIADTGAILLITESDDGQLQIENLSGSVAITIVVDGAPIELGPGEHLTIVINNPPVCNAGGPYTGECQGAATTLTLDGSGSTDPDGDPLTYFWTTDCQGGTFNDQSLSNPELTLDTATNSFPSCGVELVVEDPHGGSDLCFSEVTVVDSTPPDIHCNSPATITPKDATVSFTATAMDICCAEDPLVVITGYTCTFNAPNGKVIDRGQSCIINITGDTIEVIDSGGINNHITWTVEATDCSGIVSTKECSTDVVRYGKQ